MTMNMGVLAGCAFIALIIQMIWYHPKVFGKKWQKARLLFEQNIRHVSLKTELLQPHWRGIYSFRIDQKYRALFFIQKDGSAEVFAITNHYKK